MSLLQQKPFPSLLLIILIIFRGLHWYRSQTWFPSKNHSFPLHLKLYGLISATRAFVIAVYVASFICFDWTSNRNTSVINDRRLTNVLWCVKKNLYHMRRNLPLQPTGVHLIFCSNSDDSYIYHSKLINLFVSFIFSLPPRLLPSSSFCIHTYIYTCAILFIRFVFVRPFTFLL